MFLLTTALAAYPKLPTSNGFAVAVVNAANDNGVVLDRFSDHLYQVPSPDSEPTRDLLYDSYFGLEGTGWLTSADDWGVLPGTNIIWLDRSTEALTLTEYVFAPMTVDAPVLVHLLHVEGGPAVLNSLLNFHVGDTTHENERIGVVDGLLVEEGVNTGLTMRYQPLGDAVLGCTDVFSSLGALQGCPGVEGDDQVAGMQWSLDDGGWIGVVSSFGDMPELDLESLLAAEQAFWADWHVPVPEGLTPDEAQVYLQAMAFLKMGQVREPGAPHGQLLASLPASAPVGAFQHEWNIAWVRDGAYGIVALARGGHVEEAEAALAFMVRGESGLYAEEVGMDYPVSVCRYYGDGTEWSDWDDDGPNIEFDDFGLFAWAAWEVKQAGGTIPEDEVEQTLDVLVALRDDTGLLSPDSSIWERHWNGKQEHFTYSSVWGAAALTLWGRPEGDELAAAIRTHLVHDGVLVSSLEQLERGEGTLDIAAVEALNMGVVGQFGPTLDAFEALRVNGGFKRNDDGDLYDEQEWIWADLRMAEAYRRACRIEEAAALEDRVTALALANHLVIPELIAPGSDTYAGPAPMMGFGSGLYVLQLGQRGTLCEPRDTAADTGSVPSAEPDPDCGCGGGASGAALALVALVAVGRRRSYPGPDVAAPAGLP